MDTHSMMNYANELYEKSKKGEKVKDVDGNEVDLGMDTKSIDRGK